jgi:hypothetical protein
MNTENMTNNKTTENTTTENIKIDTNKSSCSILEDIKNAYNEGKFSGPLANVIATFIYIIAHAFFRFLIERLIKKLITAMQNYFVNIVV